MHASACARSTAAVLAAALLTAPAWAAAPAGVAAVWAPRRVHFVYQGFTTRYSCDGLRDEIVALLSRLQARDLKVREEPCSTGAGVPDPFPGVTVTMQVLVPAAPGTAGAVSAHWRKVVLTRGDDYGQGGKCELIEQFRHSFLPLFSARTVRLQATCVPHQITPGTYLSAEVLLPDRPGSGHR